MKTNAKRLITGFLTAFYLVLSGVCPAWAADTRIAFSDPSVLVGNEVTVNVKITSDSALGSAELMVNYDASALEFLSGENANGDAGAIKLSQNLEALDQKMIAFTLKFKALKAGDTKLTVKNEEVYDVDAQLLEVNQVGSSTVKVTSPATYSSDATLKSLKIAPGSLTPEFSPSVESYTAQVDASVASLVVSAVTANAGANVSLTGQDKLKAGENHVVVKVTAEDGQTVKNYTILVTKAEGGETVPDSGEDGTVSAEFGDLSVTIGETEYRIASSFDERSLPEGFEAETFDYKGNEIMAGKGLEKDLILFYLKDVGGNGDFYIYDSAADTMALFVEVESGPRAIVIMPLDQNVEIPEGFVERQVEIDGKRTIGWVEKSESGPQFCLFYGMNWNGEKAFYRYDLSEKTIQRFFASGVSNETYTDVATKYNELLRDSKIQFYLLIGVSVLAVILLIALIVLIRNSSRPGPGSRNGGWRGETESEPAEEALRVRRSPKREPDRFSPYSAAQWNGEPLYGQIPDDENQMEEREGDGFERERNKFTHPMEKNDGKVPGIRALSSTIPAQNGKPDEDFEFIDLDD